MVIPSRQELEDWGKGYPENTTDKPLPEETEKPLPPDFSQFVFESLEDLREIAKQYSKASMMVLVTAAVNPGVVTTQQLSAAEKLLDIAFGKDRQDLRAKEQKVDAFREMEAVIQQMKNGQIDGRVDSGSNVSQTPEGGETD